MNHPISRRQFIGVTATASASAASLLTFRTSAASGASSLPVGCRDTHLKATGKPDAWSALRGLGAEITEASVSLDLSCPALFHPERKYSLIDDGLKRLQDDLAQSGCRISAFALSNQFDERLEEELACVRAVLKAAPVLGVSAVRIDLWPKKISADKFLPFAVSTCKSLCEMAEGTKVGFGIENHGHTTNNPAFLKSLFAAVGSPHLGVTLDCANLYWFGHPLDSLYGIYEELAPRVFHTHLKNIRYPEDKRNTKRPVGWEYDKYSCPIYDGDIDFARLLKILVAANYKGDLCVEDEALGHFPESERGTVLEKEIAFLKNLRNKV